ncbi:BTB/POZ domain-containing protein 16-like isoform X1 [Lingula anatina]|uniref:BTB/POZ domain-containing protein 16 n=1 Tax=Lingula anatina TaxID=7574 RepID=A0A1S3J1Q9_LINAN|nr:BTB/POZ domain-containing protein 16 [Lingula anatina]XP_013403759.1 BTB/POZ domain-containing protein 16-like isoform X1 [Lingula anatina]|eukprot:XP_013400904.1 BTB/POZ domain-containing protein 16 [Lingula anatina]
MMAEAKTMTYLPPKLHTSYYPTFPPKPSEDSLSYIRSVLTAPTTALMGVVVDGRKPEREVIVRHAVTPRCRVRKMVGGTNRWRLPESLGSDLLGSSQALRAINLPYNESMVHILTAENPHQSINLDMEKPYKFPLADMRPRTTTGGDRPVASSMLPQCPSPPYSAQPKPKYAGIPPIPTFVPSRARPAKPMDVFHYHSKRTTYPTGPDVLLHCAGMDWELHRPFLQKSETLSSLLNYADNPCPRYYYKNKASETLDNYINRSHIYSNEYREISSRLNKVEVKDEAELGKERRGLDHPAHTSARCMANMTVITLDLKDPVITKHSIAVALGNLYHDETEVEVVDVVGVLAVAYHLKFKHLENGCARIMMRSIRSRTVCSFYQAAVKYKQHEVATSCERWLECNLIPQLSTQIQLRDLPMDVLQKILKSSRLFTFNEYSLYKVLAYWVFLQMNPQIQLMPSHSSVLAYFNSLPKNSSLLEREEGQAYAPLFQTLRLHGIIDSSHIQDIQQMNILPQSWIVHILAQHYQALHGGGDMTLMTNFNAAAIRQGFIVDDEPPYHSEVFSLHGFHFEIKAVRTSKRGTYSFYMQRLKPTDPTLTFRQCERATFSMRPDRDVKYKIMVQTVHDGEQELYTTGPLTQRFGLGDKTSRSEVMTVDNLVKPIFVSFALIFPPS